MRTKIAESQSESRASTAIVLRIKITKRREKISRTVKIAISFISNFPRPKITKSVVREGGSNGNEIDRKVG